MTPPTPPLGSTTTPASTPAITSTPALALYQPDIPQNTGTLLRLGACLGVDVHVIGPVGFRLDDAALKRAGMDYLDRARLTKHLSYEEFCEWRTGQKRRSILLTTKAEANYLDFSFRPGDFLMLGRESSGVPDHVHQQSDARITIPMVDGVRSLNMAVAAAMVVSEALRQTNTFPQSGSPRPTDPQQQQ